MQANPHVARLRMMLDMTMRQAGLGAKIKEARIKKGWRQKELAAAVHVEPVTVSRWERGATTPDLQKLGLVATALDVPLVDLVGERASERSEGGEILELLVLLQAGVVELRDGQQDLRDRIARVEDALTPPEEEQPGGQ